MSDVLAVRGVTADDLDAILHLEEAGFESREQWSRDSWAAELDSDTRVVVGIGDPLLGVISVQVVGGVAEITRVVVAPESRGRGHGRAVAAAGIAIAVERECEELLLEVRHDNVVALGLYASLGFEELARREGYYGDGLDAVICRLDLEEW